MALVIYEQMGLPYADSVRNKMATWKADEG
jgi:hypothetical protein